MDKKQQNIGILQMVICAMLWSLGGLLIKYVNMNPFVIAGGRSLFSAITVAIYMLLTKQKLIFSRNATLSGAFMCLLFFLFVTANKHTTAANAIVLQYTGPVYIILLSAIFFHKKPSKVDILTVVATLCGIAVFVFDGLESGNTFGDCIALLSGFAMGTLFVLVGNTEGEEKMSGLLIGHTLCALIGLPFVPFTENTFDARGLFCLVLLGVVQLGIPYILFALASQRCNALHCSVISMIEPLMNPIWVALFQGECPSALAIGAGLFILAVITAYSIYDVKRT